LSKKKKNRSATSKTEVNPKIIEPVTPAENAISNDDLPFKKNPVRDWFEVIMYGLAIFMFLKGFVFQNFQIPTSSMENTLLIGDHLTANKCVYAPWQWDWEKSILPLKDIDRGDIVVFKYPHDIRQDYIKRCVGLPGDRFEIRNQRIYLNGELLPEHYTYYKSPQFKDRDPENRNYPMHYDTLKPGIENGEWVRPHDLNGRYIAEIPLREFLGLSRQTLLLLDPHQGPYYEEWLEKQIDTDGFTIPDGYYLMMGDNRNFSADSRYWGLVPRPLIEGRAYCIWWSYGEEQGTHELTGFDLVWSYLRVPIRFFNHTHWERCFKIIK